MKTLLNCKWTLIPNVKKGLALLICLWGAIVAHATVIVYPQLSGMQTCQFAYTVQARDHGSTTWKTVSLYNALVTNASGTQVNTTVGNFDCSGSTDIQITFSTTVTSAGVYPASLNATPTISGSTINFTIGGPAKFYVDINGDHYGNCIHIGANPLEVNPPNPGDANVIYIPTGTYDTNVYTLTSGQTLYIQGGASVAGVVANNVSNVKVIGRGFIYRASYNAIEVKSSSNVTIDGLIDMNHGWGGGGGCGMNCAQSTNVSISNTMGFSSKKWGDGYDIFCSNGVRINNVFLRTNDDAIAFYGGGKSGYTGNCKNIIVTNSTLLPDLAHSFHVGVYGDTTGIGKEIRDIVVANIDICNQSRTTSQGAIHFTVGDKVRAANIKFSNVRVQDFKAAAFISMNVVYNSTYNYVPGRTIDSIYYTNCSYTGSANPPSSINGYDASRKVTNVFFNNLTINGTTITSASAGNFGIGSFTNNITFSTLGLTPGSTYKLIAQNSGKCANPSGGSSSTGINIVQNTYAGNAYQKWTLIDAGNGFYNLRNVNDNLNIDINGGSIAAGANAIQWTPTSANNQQFLVIPENGGYYSVMARHSGNILNVNGGSTSDGATIIQFPYTLGATNQFWSFGAP
jgi:hypothetical protein